MEKYQEYCRSDFLLSDTRSHSNSIPKVFEEKGRQAKIARFSGKPPWLGGNDPTNIKKV